MNVAAMTQRQWYSRKEDEKFESLEALSSFLKLRRDRSNTIECKLADLEFRALNTEDDPMGTIDLVTKDGHHFMPTHWSFGQMCALIKGHPSYLRELPANIAVQALNWNLKQRVLEKNRGMSMMVHEPLTDDAPPILQAAVSQKYGRIWDADLAGIALELVHQSGDRFSAPVDWGGVKRSLFAGDRDCHILLTDGGSIVNAGTTVDGKDDILYRGFIMGNSEVGARAWYWATFLFRWVCGNFAIHGIEQVQFQKVIHTPSAPGRFAAEALPALLEYVNRSPKSLEATIRKAKETVLPKQLAAHTAYFQHRGFSQHETQRARMMAMKEEGGSETLWQMINGFTGFARSIKFADVKTDLETRAGKLLEMVAA